MHLPRCAGESLRNIHETSAARKKDSSHATAYSFSAAHQTTGPAGANPTASPATFYFLFSLLVVVQIEDAWLDVILMQLKQPDGARQVEAFRACAARIEEQRAAPLTDVSLMAVAEDHCFGHALLDDALLGGAHLLDRGELVTHVEGASLDDGHALVRKAHRIGVIVAAHGDDGRNLFQSPDQLFVAYIACVNDAMRTGKQAQHTLIQLTVCVRDDPDEHRS